MDYKTLFQEGIRQLERLNGGAWTDFNAHDPGITLLEQLCYGLTDLSYRIGHPIPDLLAEGGSDPFASLHPAQEILPCAPVTLADLRRLVLDVEGVRNAWVELIQPEMQSPPTFYQEDGTDYSLYLGKDPGSSGVPASAESLSLRGLYRVFLDIDETQNSKGRAEIKRKVADRLHAMRPLGEDVPVGEITVLSPQWIQVAATIDVDAVEDLPALAAEVVRALDDEISPTVRFSSLAELLESGQSLEQIFDGPRLSHGFLTEEALRRSVREPVIHPSDLMRRIMDVPGVRAVSRIQVRNATDQTTANTNEKNEKNEKWEDYSLPVNAGSIARLAREEFSAITFRREGRALPFPNASKTEEAIGEVGISAADGLTVPSGRSRSVAHYTSVQQQLPTIYGVGDHAPSDAATPERRAQARQLQGYLLFFDQLMANDFAQLGHLKNLLGFASADHRTYVSQRVDAAGGSDLLSKDDVWLQGCVESVDAGLQRKQRLLKHLLARFAEEPELPDGHTSAEPGSASDSQTSLMLEFLRKYPQLSSSRGTGPNLLVSTSRSWLEERFRLLLGCDPDDFFVLEHILLRPLKEDAFPVGMEPPLSSEIPLPLLSKSAQPDPYSLQLSIVLRSDAASLRDRNQIEIERRLRMETPAHLFIRFVWLDQAKWPSVYQLPSPSEPLGAYQQWRNCLQTYTVAFMGSMGSLDKIQIPKQDIWQLRATRDLLIDLVGIGETYPLRDVELAAKQVVAGEQGQVTITPSQLDVTYGLYSDVETSLAGERQCGNGAMLTLTTSAQLTNARTFAVKATKTGTDRWTYLSSKITIPVGLNFQLAATIEPTLVDYGGSVTVTVKNSQAGVSYSLWTGETETLLQAIPGATKDGEREKDISIIASSMQEDVTIWVRVERKTTPTDCGFLTTRLPLAVRANPDWGVTLRELIVDHEAFATIQIAGTQKNVTYTAYLRDLHDADFAPDTDRSLRFVGTAQEPARVWDAGTVYRAVNPVGSGTGPATPPLSLTLQEALTEDCLIAVRAQKTHTSKLPNQPPTQFTSDVQLRTMVYVLVRPDKRNSPPNKLSLRAKDRSLTVSGGQPGVFYSIFPDGTSKDPLAEPAYFHKRDELDAQKNKGIGQLWIGTDLVVVGELDGNATTDPADRHPKDPTLDLKSALSAGSVHVMAKKARTGVEWTTRQVFPVDKENGPTPS